jgi:DNA-binding NarL/FixJ family response regulator
LGKLRILLGDDHTLMRHGLRKVLEARPEWEIVAEAGDGRSAVRQVLALEPDVAVLDIGMPLLNGIEATAQITRRAPDVKVLILSMYADEAYVIQAVRAGARGYLLKDSAGIDLIGAIASLAAGTSFFSPPIARVLLDEYGRRLAASPADTYESLSEREREIVQMVAEGRSSREMARLLGITPGAVEAHRAQILQKLDCHNTAELVLYAVRRRIVA